MERQQRVKYPSSIVGSLEECKEIAAALYKTAQPNSSREYSISKEHIEQMIWVIAKQFLQALWSDANSKTVKGEMQRMSDIISTAKKLHVLLHKDSGPFDLLRPVSVKCGFHKQVPGRNLPNDEPMPAPNEWALVHESEILARPLAVLQEVVGTISKHLASDVAGRGQGKLYRRLAGGTPLTQLCASCAWLLRETQGQHAAPIKTDGEGPVSELARKIWHFTVGSELSHEEVAHAARIGAQEVAQGGTWRSFFPRSVRIRVK